MIRNERAIDYRKTLKIAGEQVLKEMVNINGIYYVKDNEYQTGLNIVAKKL